MNTWLESILAAAQTTLIAANVAGGAVERSRTSALARGELPAVVVRRGAETVENTARGIAVRRAELLVEVHHRGSPAEQVADPVVAAVHSALMADQTLGGHIARLVEDGSEVEYAEGDDTAVMVTLKFLATYATPAGDITRLA